MQIAIQVSELRFATEDGVLVLDDLSFGVSRSGFVFVVGPPSSGKTLLLRLILRELAPTGGQILLLGRNVARLPPHKVRELRRRVAYVPECPTLLTDRTVAGNLTFKLRALGYRGADMEEQMLRALELTRLLGQEQVGVAELGEGDRRRLALAVALCPEPTVLLCDDQFRDLPSVLQDELMEVLFGIQRADTTVLATSRDADIPKRHGFRPAGETESPYQVVYLRQGVMV